MKKNSGLSVAGFILAFFVPVLGLIMSIIALKKAKNNDEGIGLCIAGIVISSIFIAIVVIFVGIAVFLSYKRDKTSQDLSDIWGYKIALGEIENYANEQYQLCEVGFDYDKEVFNEDCELKLGYSLPVILNAGFSLDDIEEVELEIEKDKVVLVGAADGSGKYEGATYEE